MRSSCLCCSLAQCGILRRCVPVQGGTLNAQAFLQVMLHSSASAVGLQTVGVRSLGIRHPHHLETVDAYTHYFKARLRIPLWMRLFIAPREVVYKRSWRWGPAPAGGGWSRPAGAHSCQGQTLAERGSVAAACPRQAALMAAGRGGRRCGWACRKEDDGTYVMLISSVEHAKAPVEAKPWWQWYHPVRAHVRPSSPRPPAPAVLHAQQAGCSWNGQSQQG